MTTVATVAIPADIPVEDNPRDEDIRSLRLWQSGNMRGYNELVQRYEKPLFHFIYRMIHDAGDAKDILQETFLRLYQSVSRLREDKSIKAWLYQTANHLCIDYFRKHKPGRVTAMDHQDSLFEAVVENSQSDRPPQPDDLLQDQLMQQNIMQAIEQLPNKQRAIMTLRGCKEMSLKEIADIMQCNEKTVGTTLFAARKRLFELLRPMLEELYGSQALQDF